MSDSLPQMDVAYLHGNGYGAINELMRAIILRVVEDFNSGNQELIFDAVAYMNDEDEEYIFSFRAICQHLGMDPGKTREGIMHATHRISTRRRAA